MRKPSTSDPYDTRIPPNQFPRNRKSIVLLPGKLNLYPQGDIWHARIKTGDGWKSKSLKTNDVQRAQSEADELYEMMRKARKLQKSRFSTYAQKYREELRLNPKPIHPAYEGILQNWIMPFFGKLEVSNITEDTIKEYEAWRNETRGEKLAKDTVNNHHGIIRNILLIAAKDKAMDRNQIPENFRKFNTGYEGESRPIFDEDEFDELLVELQKWIAEAEAEKYAYKRKLLYYYVMFLYNSGIRPGEEVNTLKWMNIKLQWRKPGTNDRYVRIRVIKGKRGGRPVQARAELRQYLLELQELTGRSEPDDYVFCDREGRQVKRMFDDFNRFIKRTKLRFDASGDARTLYSLRHMFITNAILEATIPINVIARNCGTSVEMIYRIYDKTAPDHFAAEFAR